MQRQQLRVELLSLCGKWNSIKFRKDETAFVAFPSYACKWLKVFVEFDSADWFPASGRRQGPFRVPSSEFRAHDLVAKWTFNENDKYITFEQFSSRLPSFSGFFRQSIHHLTFIPCCSSCCDNISTAMSIICVDKFRQQIFNKRLMLNCSIFNSIMASNNACYLVNTRNSNISGLVSFEG